MRQQSAVEEVKASPVIELSRGKKTVKSDDLSFDLFSLNSQMRDLFCVKVRVEIW